MIEYNIDSTVYKNRAKILEENGWVAIQHPDNWVRNEWFNHPTIDVEKAGESMETAWKIVNREQQQLGYDEENF